MAIKANKDIRLEARKAKVSLWAIADELGIPESSFYRQLRYEFSDDKKLRVRQAINDIVSREK